MPVLPPVTSAIFPPSPKRDERYCEALIDVDAKEVINKCKRY
jgi:hypothetical protein